MQTDETRLDGLRGREFDKQRSRACEDGIRRVLYEYTDEEKEGK